MSIWGDVGKIVNYIGYAFPFVNAGYSYWGAGMKAMAPKIPTPDPGAIKRTMTGANAYQRVIYGERIVGGKVAFWGVTGHKEDILHMVVVFAGHEVDSFQALYLDGTSYGSLGATAEFYTGTSTQTASAALMAALPSKWTSAHRLRGLAFAYVKMPYSQGRYPQGIPNIEARIKGKKVYDPRTGLTVWSNNNALCCRDWLELTGKASDTEFDDTLVTASANRCDELINGLKRHTCNAVLELAGSPKEKALAIAASMGGTCYYRQGKWRILGSQYTAPTVTLTESDLAGPIQIVARGDKSKVCNKVRGTYVPIDKRNIETDFPPVSSSEALAEDLEELVDDISLPFTTNVVEAQRLAKAHLLQSRATMMVEFPAKYTAMRLAPGERVALNITQAGFSGTVFRVGNFRAGVTNGVVLSLHEDSANIWDWTPGEEVTLPDPAELDLPDPYTLNPPDTLTVTETTYSTNTPGVVMARVTLSWASGDIRTDKFIVHGQGPGDAAAKELAVVDAGDNTTATFEHNDAKPGTWSYYVYARSVLGVMSTAATWTGTVVGTSTADPGTVTGFAVTPLAGGRVRLTWSPLAGAILDYSIKSGASWAAGTYVAREIRATAVEIPVTTTGAITYWIKARSTATVESTTAASVTYTPSLTTPGAFTITPGIGTARITWTDTADKYKAGYELQIAPNVAGAPGTWATMQKGLSTAYTYIGTPGIPAWVRVRAYDGPGNVSAWNSQTQFTPDYVKALDSANIPTGYNLQINSDFDNGTPDGWEVSTWGVLPTIAVATIPRSGKYVAKNSSGVAASAQSTRLMPCNPDRTYILEGYATTISGTTGTYSLRVNFYNSAGGATTPAYLSAADGVVPAASPTFYSLVFGAGQASVIPTGAVSMRIVVAINPSAGNRVIETQGLRIREAVENLWVKDLAVNKLASGSMVSKTIDMVITPGGGNTAIRIGKGDFGDPTAGIILGIDDSDGDIPKFEIGDSENYLKWDPVNGMRHKGPLNADNIVAGGIRGINVNAASHTTKGSYLTQACSAGATTLNVHNTADFPSSGSGWIIDSTNDRDEFSWTGKTATTLTGVTGILAHGVGVTIIPKIECLTIDSNRNDMRFHSDRGDGVIEELVGIGSFSGTGYLLRLGSNDAQKIAVYALGKIDNYLATFMNYGTNGSGIYSDAKTYGIYALGTASGIGVGGVFEGSQGQIELVPLGTNPTHSARRGTLYVTAAGDIYINKSIPSPGTTWVKIG